MEGYREPNGRLSRSGRDHLPADTVALDARMKQFGVSRSMAKDQKASTFIGRLCLSGPATGLSEGQYEAAVTYRSLYNAWQRAVQSPGAIYDPQAIGGDGTDPEAYAEWVASVKARYTAARQAVHDAQFDNRVENLLAALDYIILRDQQVHHLIGAARLVCNALARHFKIVEGSRAAA